MNPATYNQLSEDSVSQLGGLENIWTDEAIPRGQVRRGGQISHFADEAGGLTLVRRPTRRAAVTFARQAAADGLTAEQAQALIAEAYAKLSPG